MHLVRGVIKTVEPNNNVVRIQHEEIPNFMPAMTMPFRVKDAKELEGLQQGETVWFRLWVTADESWIDNIKKEKAQSVPPTSAPAPEAAASPEREEVRVVRDVPELSVGDIMPDYQFTNELGQTIHLNDFRGKALAFTFIYTRCPLPEFCPRMSGNFAEVMKQLKAMPNGPTNWHLLSISIDPHWDSPTVLRGYAQAFANDAEHWNFVTGSIEDIDAITEQFQLTIVKRGSDWDHKLRTVVVDANGRIQDIIYGNEWKPEALVQEIVKAANPPDQSAAAAP
jgi:protein SCO1/2